MNMKKLLAGALASAMIATALVVPTSAEETYKAGLTFQTQAWTYRNGLWQTEVLNGTDGMEIDDSLYEVNDATFTEDGTYTCSVKGIPMEGDGNSWHTVGICTSIPEAMGENVTLEIVSVEGATLNAANKPSVEGASIEENGTEKGLKWNLINEWNTGDEGVADKPVISDIVVKDDDTADITVTFKISGLGGASTETPDEGENNPPNTGVAGVAAVVGLAVLATGALAVAKNRK